MIKESIVCWLREANSNQLKIIEVDIEKYKPEMIQLLKNLNTFMDDKDPQPMGSRTDSEMEKAIKRRQKEYNPFKSIGLLDGDKLVGICNVGLTKGKESGKVGVIIDLYIEDKYRSSGYGAKMLNIGVKFLYKSGASNVYVGTLYNNTKGMDFYKKNGFVPQGVTFIHKDFKK